jgi:hypothetical protein
VKGGPKTRLKQGDFTNHSNSLDPSTNKKKGPHFFSLQPKLCVSYLQCMVQTKLACASHLWVEKQGNNFVEVKAMCKETKPFQKQNERRERETLCQLYLQCHNVISCKSTTNPISKQSIPIETNPSSQI